MFLHYYVSTACTDFVVLVCQDWDLFSYTFVFWIFRLGTKNVQSIFPAVFICLCFCSIIFISGALHKVTITTFSFSVEC